MLSPNRYPVPKDYLENLLFRQMILQKCTSHKMQDAVIEMCRLDFFLFVDVFVWQINPNKFGKEIGPFIIDDYKPTWLTPEQALIHKSQEEAVKETMRVLFDIRDDMIWEKSRERGGTWLALIMAVWLCLFHQNKRVLLISHSEQAVDKAGNEGSLFAKIKFIIDHLPAWMQQGATKRKLGYSFRRGSSINGFSSTGRSGVGDRAAFIILDEFAKQENAKSILGQTKDTGKCLIISTHYGDGTTFYELTQREDIHKCIFHWTQDETKARGLYRYDPLTSRVQALDTSYDFGPDYKFIMDGSPTGGPFPGIRSPWYDAYCRRTGDAREVAMHQDIDPKGSNEQYFDRLVIQELKRRALPPWFVGDIHYDHDTGEFKGFVRSDNGPLRLWASLSHDGKPAVGRHGAGLDPSAGVGATPTCWSCFNADTGHKVCEYVTGRISPERFAPIAFALNNAFKDAHGYGAKFCWETNGMVGGAFTKAFLILGYSNVFYRDSSAGTEGDATAQRTMIPGWMKTNRTWPAVISSYKSALQKGDITNYSEYALDECLSYAWEEGDGGGVEHSKRKSCDSPSGAGANHGDIVVADALAWKMCEVLGKSEKPKAKVALPSIYTLEGRRKLFEQKRKRDMVYD